MTDEGDGVRERKRQETRRRITEAGVRLISSKGYEQTTLDEIAEAAGISRRSFFHHFKSKDDILLSLQGSMARTLITQLETMPPGGRPLEVMQTVMLDALRQFSGDDLIRIDRLMRASPAVQARKQASYAEEEKLLHAALVARWPGESVAALRLIAMFCIGTGRIATEAWSMGGYQRPLEAVVREYISALEEL